MSCIGIGLSKTLIMMKRKRDIVKIIFLDIDGVMNSRQFYLSFEEGEMIPPVDPICVKNLRMLVERTGAGIVLSSSWRGGWEPRREDTMEYTLLLVDALALEGLEISDKTIFLDDEKREAEVRHYLRHAPEKVEGYVILDDWDFEWARKGLDKRWLKTDFDQGGFREEDIETAASILNRRCSILERLKW